MIEVTVIGPHGCSELVKDDETDRYHLVGDPPDRHSLICIALSVLQELTEEEREDYGLEGIYL